MRARGAMIGAIREILLGPASELGVGQHQCVVPLAKLFQCALERDHTTRELAQESRLRARLAAVGVETGESDADDGDAGLVGDDLTGGPDRVAESALRKFRFESVVGVEMRRGLN